jgi:glycerate 2-kinase
MCDIRRNTLLSLFKEGVSAVRGDASVNAWLAACKLHHPTHILAVGKAATAMFEGLPSEWSTSVPTYLVTKTGHIGNTEFSGNVLALETSHPIPDLASLDAGKRALDFVANCGVGSRLLMLVSGGASSLVEHLKTDVQHKDLEALTRLALAEGMDISEINERRKSISAIKGGGLLASFKGKQVDVLAISDVAGDSIEIIGSGIGARPKDACFIYDCSIVASNAVAREAIERSAKSIGLKVISNEENMYADVPEIAARIANEILKGQDGLYIYGGEPTVILPKNPGQGGRNQALALDIARHIINRDGIVGLVAGTDGTDGPTDAAGAFLDGEVYLKLPGVEKAQKRADSGSYLARTGDLIITGPTGTNVMDLAIFLKHT